MFVRSIPVLHITDAAQARRFYRDLLGFEILFEHCFGEGLPIYMGLRHGNAELHLSEHANDGAPGAAVRFEVDKLRAFRASLQGVDLPAVENKPWGFAELVLTDPSGNRLLLVERLAR